MKLIRKNRINREELAVDETIFSLTNGTLGVRGVFAEGYGTGDENRMTVMNGFYDYYDYKYEEYMPGFPKQGQKLALLPDGTTVNVRIGGVHLNKNNALLKHLTQSLDMETGLYEREAIYSLNDNTFRITEEKLVPLSFPNVIVQRITIESPNYEGEVLIDSYLQLSQRKAPKQNDPRLHSGEDVNLVLEMMNPLTGTMQLRTKKSNQVLYSRIMHRDSLQFHVGDQMLWGRKVTRLDREHPVVLEKYILHVSNSNDERPLDSLEKLTNKVLGMTFEEIVNQERKIFHDFWSTWEFHIGNNKDYETLLRYNTFQLYRHGPRTPYNSIAAKGLTGEGYEGHYFWDTEIYMLPFFVTQSPEIARNILLYRYHTMSKAREEAKFLGVTRGVKIPWRTINGSEASPYFLAGSAQYHINSDIAYAVLLYFDATNDVQFLMHNGFEMLVETARFMTEMVVEVDGVYHLNAVTGPDEYTTLVDDNYYTNRMLQYHLERLAQLYHDYYSNLQSVINRLNVTPTEIKYFEGIAKNIHLSFDQKLGIVAQDANFLQKKRLDLSTIPKDHFPLLLNYHPLFLTSHQVLKQADALLSLMLLGHDKDVILNSFNYYEPITTHDSSLSKCVHSILAFQLHLDDIALPYFKEVLETDLKDVHQNTKDGLHMANLGGSYMNFMYGIVGLRITQDHVKLSPRVFDDISYYAVTFRYRGHSVKVTVDKKVTIVTEEPVKIELYNQSILVNGTYVAEMPNII
jgi:alpha,alpha-trehalose phosphorylase